MVPAEEERMRVLGMARALDVMETHVSVATADAAATDAGARMIHHKIGCLPVIEPDGRLVGIITEEDFLRWATSHMQAPHAEARASA